MNALNIVYNQDNLNKLKCTIEDEIKSILLFAKKRQYHFTKLEEEVHELRRKLRWLSIYAHALGGLVQLKTTVTKTKFQQAYFTEKIINLRYNKLPKTPLGADIIELDKNSFLALSWILKELGTIKDLGLKLQYLRDAIFISENISEIKANEKALQILNLEMTASGNLLKKASEIVEVFLVKDKILNKLVI